MRNLLAGFVAVLIGMTVGYVSRPSLAVTSADVTRLPQRPTDESSSWQTLNGPFGDVGSIAVRYIRVGPLDCAILVAGPERRTVMECVR